MKKYYLFLIALVLIMFSFRSNSQNYILNENFDNNNNNWDISNSDEAVSSIKKGKYNADIKSGIYWLDRLVLLDINEDKDWVFESEMVKNSGESGYGLTWGGNNGGSRYNFFIYSDLSYTINKWKDYNVSSFVASEQSSAIKPDGKTNKLSIKKTGYYIKFYVNDQYLTQIEYEPLFGKYFGFYANSGSLNISVDNIKVYYTAESKPEPTTPTVSAGIYILKEDFSNNSNSWPLQGATGVNRTISNGKYIWEGTGTEFNSNWDFIPINLDQNKDFMIESTIKKTGGSETDWGFGLLWGDDQNRFTVFGSTGACSYLGDIYTRKHSDAVFKGNSQNKMTIKKIKSTLTFYVNDIYVGEAPFVTFSTNQIGFYAYMNNVRIEVDNLYVSYLTGSNTNTGNSNLSPEAKLVSDFIQIWIDDSGNNSKLMEYISPRYLKANNLDKTKYSVNLYYPKGFKILNFDKSSGRVTVTIWGENNAWTHKIIFKVVTESGKLYLYPSQFTESMYIYPWESVVDDVVVNDPVVTNDLSPEKLLTDFIQIWIDDSGNNDKLMEYISPAYLDANNLDKTKYSVNLYYPKGFKIDYVDKESNRVTVLIWDENKTWTRKLIFKVTEENNKLYLYPSKYTESMYIYPWESDESEVSTNKPVVKPEPEQEQDPSLLADEARLVYDFLKIMKDDQYNETSKMKFVSPKYLKKNNLNPSDYKVNTYTISGFNVKKFDKETGMVQTWIWGENKKWIMQLDFKVVREDGKLFLYPSRFSDYKYIDAWTTAVDVPKD